MARQWKVVSPEEAKQHPLYGVKNWLAVFAFGVLLGILRELGTLAGEAHGAGLTIGQLFAIQHPAVTFAKIAISLQGILVAVIYWLLIAKHQNFRQVTTGLLLFSWPAAALIGLVDPFPGLGEALGTSFFSWGLSCAAWVTYLQRSRRVRVTFEHRVLSGETSLAEPAHERASSPTASIATFQFVAPTPHHTPPASTSRVVRTTNTPLPKAATTAPSMTVPSEEFWSAASSEFDGPDRRSGLWARVFSEAQGNEPIAKANYLRHRADELQHQHSVLLEQERLNAEAAERAAAFAHLTEQQRTYAELPKGVCPGCDAIIPLSADPCPKCGAMFGPGSAWKAQPIDERGQIEAFRAAYLAGRRPTVDEVIFLAGASSRDGSLVTLSDRFRAETLLHWAAKLGLPQEASLLIANGANAATPNGNGQKPFELAQDLELRGVLRAAARPTET